MTKETKEEILSRLSIVSFDLKQGTNIQEFGTGINDLDLSENTDYTLRVKMRCDDLYEITKNPKKISLDTDKEKWKFERVSFKENQRERFSKKEHSFSTKTEKESIFFENMVLCTKRFFNEPEETSEEYPLLMFITVFFKVVKRPKPKIFVNKNIIIMPLNKRGSMFNGELNKNFSEVKKLTDRIEQGSVKKFPFMEKYSLKGGVGIITYSDRDHLIMTAMSPKGSLSEVYVNGHSNVPNGTIVFFKEQSIKKENRIDTINIKDLLFSKQEKEVLEIALG